MTGRRVPRAARGGAAIAAGALVWTSFPPLNWWPAAVAGVAALTLLTRGRGLRGAAVLGYVFGLGVFVPMLSFLRGLGVDAWLVVAVIESLWFALLGAATALVTRTRWWPIAVPVLYVGQEWLRDRVPFGGFPWGRLGFGQADGPLLHLARFGGAPLLTFAVAIAGGAVAVGVVAATARRGVRAVTAVVVAAAVVTLPLAIHVPGGTDSSGRRAVAAVVQGNVPRLGLDEFAQARAVTSDHLAETLRLAGDVDAGRTPRPDFVVWPENASDLDPRTDVQARAIVTRAVAAVGVPVLVGAVIDGPGPDHVRNAAIVWSPATGPGQTYVKRHLVPFGEYLPMRGLLTRLVSRFGRISEDFVAGSRPGVLDVGPARVADVICYEVADDAVVRAAVDGGGQVLVVQTNNATYEHRGDDGYGGETAQQLAMSKVRAVEHARAVLVAATSGVSAVISPDGTVTGRTGVFVPATLVASIPLRSSRTPADVLGPWPERGVAALALMALVAAAVTTRRRRESGAAPRVSAGVPAEALPVEVP